MYIDDRVEERLQKIELAAAEGKIVAVGEAGVDRNALAPVEVQLKLFERQAEIAGRYGLPLIVHGVRAIPELITAYKKCRSHQKWIMHGFVAAWILYFRRKACHERRVAGVSGIT